VVAITSVHLCDVGAGRALPMLRGPGKGVAGLLSSEAATVSPLRTGALPRPKVDKLAFVAFWDDATSLDRFLADHRYGKRLARSPGWNARLEPLRAHGAWPGLPDDTPKSRAVDDTDDNVVVVTLGRLRLPKALTFLRTSMPAEAAATRADGFLGGAALARPPFVATVSLWASAAAAADYAYQGQAQPHPHAIDVDRQVQFHHRSAFIRFRPLQMNGSLTG
jgi:hypothetical protein